MCPRAPAEGNAETRCSNLLPHEIYKHSVSSVEAGIGMEGQIMSIKMHILDVISRFSGPQNAPKSLASGASPQAPLEGLQRSLRPLVGFKRAYF